MIHRFLQLLEQYSRLLLSKTGNTLLACLSVYLEFLIFVSHDLHSLYEPTLNAPASSM